MDEMDGYIGAKQKHTRRRLNPTIRWNEIQTHELLEHVIEEVGIHPGRFEKPTAQIFYAKICEKASAAIRHLSWQILKNKMRNLKTTFLAAATWKAHEGAKLIAEGKECLYHDHLKRVCPYFDLLERLYGHLVQARSVSLLGAAISSDLDEYTDEMVTNEVLSSELDSMSTPSHAQSEMPTENVFIKLEETEPTITHSELQETNYTAGNADPIEDYNAIINRPRLEYTPEPSTASNSETDFTANRTLVERFPRKKPATEMSSVSQLVTMQEKKLKFEVMKLQQQLNLERQKLDLERDKLCLAREQSHVDMEMKRLQLQHEMDLKKLAMERDERIALARIRLEVESQERIRKYELDLKATKE
ncbi:uncharacterized protein LOC109420073 isoform X1 [Aedes albopictus]|uniref:Myb/SANT-like DNA-binding domain-containing protein n=1 Tax=Aedes albopictus TaxID=7160 RepID=A0ABM1ZXN1_AEDAL